MVTYALFAYEFTGVFMPHIKLPEGLQGIRSAMAFRPETAKPLNELAEALLHAPNSLPQGDRELIATYVSHLKGASASRNLYLSNSSCIMRLHMKNALHFAGCCHLLALCCCSMPARA
jgi:alkylhydroperoxidase/carboxymuconolactone decarboxylase family protein YurZ